MWTSSSASGFPGPVQPVRSSILALGGVPYPTPRPAISACSVHQGKALCWFPADPGCSSEPQPAYPRIPETHRTLGVAPLLWPRPAHASRRSNCRPAPLGQERPPGPPRGMRWARGLGAGAGSGPGRRLPGPGRGSTEPLATLLTGCASTAPDIVSTGRNERASFGDADVPPGRPPPRWPALGSPEGGRAGAALVCSPAPSRRAPRWGRGAGLPVVRPPEAWGAVALAEGEGGSAVAGDGAGRGGRSGAGGRAVGRFGPLHPECAASAAAAAVGLRRGPPLAWPPAAGPCRAPVRLLREAS